MPAQTAAEEEFQAFLTRASTSGRESYHPADVDDYAHDQEHSDRDEEETYRADRIDASMRMPTFERSVRLPPRDFDDGRTTGVKGVIADARSYEAARTSSDHGRRSSSQVRADQRKSTILISQQRSDEMSSDEEEFLERWRAQRRLEIQAVGPDIRNRRTSPSVRRYGRFDEVDALGYLDAIEKVRRETVVVVFVYDHECEVSAVIEDAITPLVAQNPFVHFVKVHYEAIEFDNAGVPAILGYKNQGDLFANLTYIIDQIPEGVNFDTPALENILRKSKIL